MSRFPPPCIRHHKVGLLVLILACMVVQIVGANEGSSNDGNVPVDDRAFELEYERDDEGPGALSWGGIVKSAHERKSTSIE